MHDIFFVLPHTSDNPHASIFTKNKGAKPTTHFELYFTHFDEWTAKNFVNVDYLPYIPKDTLKCISVFIYLPQSADFELTEELRDLVNNDSSTYLCLFSMHEAQLNDGVLQSALRGQQINPNKTVLVSSNLETHMTTQNKVKHVFANYWESYTRRCWRLLNGTSRIHPQERAASLPTANKKFISLNRNCKPHRVWWYYAMCKTGVVDQGHVSYLLPEIEPDKYDSLVKRTALSDKIPANIRRDFYEDFMRTCTYKELDQVDNNWLVNFQGNFKDFYHDSLFSLITESDQRKNLLSEKTWKAVYHMHPFFIIGNPEQAATLRERGYYTFEDMFGIDSVDDYPSAVKLCSIVKKKKINMWRAQVQNVFPKLEHNLQNFIHRTISWRDVERNILKVING
jgi:hypothetical protein